MNVSMTLPRSTEGTEIHRSTNKLRGKNVPVPHIIVLFYTYCKHPITILGKEGSGGKRLDRCPTVVCCEEDAVDAGYVELFTLQRDVNRLY